MLRIGYLFPFIFLSLAATSPSSLTDAVPKNFRQYKNILPNTPTNAKGDIIYGYAAIDLLVDPSGRAVDCRIVSPQRLTEYGQWLCIAMMRESRFYPAADRSGGKTYGVYRYWRSYSEMGIRPRTPDRADWYIPVKEIPKDASRAAVTIRFEVDERGVAQFCEVGKASSLASLDRIACSTLNGQSFSTKFDSGDRPVRTIRTATIGLKAGTE